MYMPLRVVIVSVLLASMAGCVTSSGEFIAKCHVERVALGAMMIREDEKCTAPVHLWKIFEGEEGIQPTEDYIDLLKIRPDGEGDE